MIPIVLVLCLSTRRGFLKVILVASVAELVYIKSVSF
jgi:hypothetical protein